LPIGRVCTLVMSGQMRCFRSTKLARGGCVAVCSLTVLEFGWWLSGCIINALATRSNELL
jgi:hypothetical protein